ncbi:MAG TPA: hypothetical protein VFG28_14990, partial [Syntrophales bacterium]|nr:hypothetical protein [Syntrophales bacterium]
VAQATRRNSRARAKMGTITSNIKKTIRSALRILAMARFFVVMAVSLSDPDFSEQMTDSNFTSLLVPVYLSIKLHKRKIGVGLIFPSDKGRHSRQILSYRTTCRQQGKSASGFGN